MVLAAKNWTRVSMHNMVLAWLRAERSEVSKHVTVNLAPLLEQADLNDPAQNRSRLRLLYMIRNLFVLEIPSDTNWFKVDNLTNAELSELYVINHPSWVDPADQNELLNVARRKNCILSSPPWEWEMPILWGHERSGPFTILEGNHRLTAYVRSGSSGLDIPVFVGLSPIASMLHMPDNCGPLIRDLLGHP